MQSERAEAIADHLKKYKPELIAGLCLKLLLPLEDDEIVSLFKQLKKIEKGNASQGT